MSENYRKDLTTGSTLNNLVKFSLPLFIGNLLQAGYNIADSIWVGRFVGTEALGAMANIFPIVFILVSVVMGLTIGTSVLVSQYAGANDEKMIRKTINNAIIVLGTGAIIVSAFGLIFNKTILTLMNVDKDIMVFAVDYLNIYFYGLIFLFGYNVFRSILNGLGDSKTPLIFLGIASILNIILDPFFIIGIGPFPKMGIQGAAFATLIAQGISFFLSLIYLNKKKHLISFKLKDYKFDPTLTYKTITIGLPTGIQQSLVSLGLLVLTSLINKFSNNTVSAYGAAIRIDQFAHLPAMSLGLAVSTLTGQNIGAKKIEQIKDVYKWGTLMVLMITGILTIIVYLFPDELIGIFSTNQSVIDIGVRYLRFVGLTYIPFGLMFITIGILRGAGDTIPPMIFSLTSLWVIRVPLANLLSKPMGSDGIWLAIAISYAITLLINQTYYFTGRWKRKKIIHT